MLPTIHIGPLTLQTFGICFALAFIAAGALVWKRFGEIGKPVDWAYEMGFAALVGGLVGSRLDFIIENYSDVKDDLLGNLFSGSGLVWYGGAIGGAIGVFLWAWWRGFLTLALLDVAAPALALGYAIGRCGCQLSGDGDYGKAWDGPWAMAYPDGTKPTDRPSTRRRSTRPWRWGWSPWCSGGSATASRTAPSSPSTWCSPAPSASWSSSSAATTTSPSASPRPS